MQASRASLQAGGRILLAAALLAAPVTSAAANTWLTVTPDGKVRVNDEAVPQAPRVVVGRCDGTRLHVTVHTVGLEFSLEQAKGGEFVVVGGPKVSFAGRIGEPALPVVRRLVIVPEGAAVELAATEGRSGLIDLEAIGFARDIWPMQPPIPMIPGALERAPFHYNEAAYMADELLPAGRVVLTELGIVRGHHLHLLEVRPVAYNPVLGTLMVWPRIEVDIRFKGGDRREERGLIAPLRDVLLNPPPTSGPIGRGSGNYLIVAADAYAAGAPMTEFISAKTAQGFDVTTHAVEPGTTKEAIKTYIESLWGTPDAPDYLLLVGDVDTIPEWVGGGSREAITDLPYACMDGSDDWYPDIALGRFSVNSVSQLQDVVDKTLYIGGGMFADPGFTRRAVLMAGTDINSGDEETHNWVAATYLTPEGIASDKLYMRTYGATTQDVRDAFNDGGRIYSVFYGHAGPGQDDRRIWNNGPYFDFDDLYGLNDGALSALLLHVSCRLGRYHLWDECFTEAWLRAPNKGAGVNIGSTSWIYYSGNPGWPEVSNLYKFVFDSIYLDGTREAGPAWQAALMRLLAMYGPINPVCRDYFEMLNVLGDPSLRMPEPAKNYLIVTPELYVDSEPLNQFINGKTARGFHVSTYEVPSGTSRSTIKTYIENLWGTPYAPEYILLVGDTDGSTSTSNTIPHWTGGGSKSATTDLPYACMDAGDDWYPDIAIGRFSVRSVSQLQNVVDKTLFVEAGNFPDPDYVKRGAFLANPSTYGTAEPTHDWVIDNYFTPNDYEGIKIYSSQGGDTQDVTDAVNAGCLFAVYFGHSSSSGWWDPSFNASNVQALSNQGLYGLVLGWSCNTAHFDYDECVGETWLREANKGAAAFISASDYIYWGSAEAWEHSVVHEKASFAAFFEDDIWEVGPAWQAGLYRYLKKHGHWDGNPQNPPEQNADVIRNFFEEFVLLGDPGLRLPQPDGFTLTPAPLSQALCCPLTNQAVFTIEVGQMGDFDEVVTLTTEGEPAGTTVDFDVNSQPPPFTATMTIDGLIGAAPGDYNIVITGTPTGGTECSTEVTLNISNAVPGSVSLLSPPNGDTDVSRTPTLIWQPSSQAVEYDLEIATDSGFTNVVYSTTVTETSHTVGVSLDSMTLYHWHVRANNGCGGSGFSAAFNFTTLEQADYFTEEFINDFDLENFTVEFIPDGSGDYYDMCGSPATELPTDPALGTTLSLVEDGYAEVTPLGGQVHLYGNSYGSFWVGDNGYITFTSGDTVYTESLDDHFNMPRISALFDDLSTPNGGTISWKELGDRVAVTWEDVPEWNTSNSNTFQVEMFFDGEIHITWLQVDSNDSIVGLSEGNGVPEVPFPESDISTARPCNQEPAFSLDAEPASQDICAPADVVYTIEVESFLGFDQPVILETTGEPAGSDVDFSVNPVEPPGTTVMTVGNTGACSPGVYSIEITGTAQGGMKRSTDVALNLSTAAPDGVTLTSPPNGEDDVSRSPTLIWQASSQALEYDLEVATDFNFINVIYNATVADPNHTVSITLDLATPYYWHVRANNACGTSGYSSPFSFTTMNMLLPVAYDMLNGETGTYTYFDDAYDGDGDNTVPLAPLSGGLGDLTDGVIATKHWNSTPGPYVGWQSVDPTITFHFTESVNIDSITLHLDDSGGGGSVQPPDDVTVSMGGTPLVFPVSDPPGNEPFAFTCDDLGLAGDTLELTIADYNAGAYMMLSEVEFYGGPNTGACCVGETCSVMAEDECLAGEGEYQGDGTDCDPNPCIAYESACLIISEVVNGVESGGCPTWIEITNTGLTDFSFIEGGVIIQTDDSNGVGVDVNLSGVTVLAGQSYVINSNQLGACTGAFPLIYGFDADFYTEVPFGDGDDRYIIADTADGSSLLDIYGEFGVDGTGEPWEYTEGYAYRLSPYHSGDGQDFAVGEWFYGGVGSLVGDNPTQLLLENTTPGIHVYDRDCSPGQYETLRPLGEDTGFDPCNSDEECPHESHCVPSAVGDPPGPGTCYAPKTRYLSIVAHPEQMPNTARRIRLQDATVLGWVGVPVWIPPASQHSGLWRSPVSDAPVYDGVGFTGLWPTLLHVSDCEIAPGYTYEVQAIVQGRDIGVEDNYSEALALNTNSTWGDVVSTCTGDECEPPDGVVGLADIMAAVTKFQGVDSAPMTWLDIAPSSDADNPDQIVGLGDIMACIGGFQGQPYPGNGPLNCP